MATDASTPLLYKNDKDVPIFECGRKERYTVREAVRILLSEHEQGIKCSKTPLKTRQNLSFLINVAKLKCWQDVKSDMNGVFCSTLRICMWTVEVDEENGVDILAKKKIDLVSEKMYHVYINSMRNKAGLCRSIFLLRGRDGEIINSVCLLQYTIPKEDCSEVIYEVPSHGNSKGKGKPFYPTKKSTLQAIKDELRSNSAAVAFKNVSRSAGGALNAREPGDLPRSRKQVYDLKRQLKMVDEVDELLHYVKNSEEPMVITHLDVPEDLWVLAKPHMTTDLSKFCTSDQLSHPLSVDPTFNFGHYEVTPFTYKHLFLKCKRTGTAPSFLGPTAMHYSKQKCIYKKIVQAVADSTPHLADKGKGFITDGEESLYSALGDVMRHATGLRCFRHFQQNCRDKLCKLGIRKRNEQKPFVDRVFGTPSQEGILDAEDKADLKARILEAKEPTDAEEVKLTGKETPEFWSYLNSHKKMIKKNMIASARRKAGMPNNMSGKPLKSYTNQSESINNKLTRQKEAMEKVDKDRVNLTKLQFTRDVWEEVDRHQQEELKLAICGLSNEYELADMAVHLRLSVSDWFDMNEEQRKAYVNEFNKMSIDDAMKGKTIGINQAPTGEASEYKEFSLDVATMLNSLNSWTEGLVDTIVKDAEALLNAKEAVQPMPSVSANAKRKFLVAAKNCKRGMYECAVFSDHVNCSCPCYKFNNLCKHSICVAEIAGILKEHLQHLKKSPRRRAPSKSGLVEPPKDAQGKKGGSHKNPYRPTREALQEASPARPFTQVHHNNKPFVLFFLDDMPDAKECRQCRIEFPRKQQITPFDIALSHEEKWLYPDPNDPGRKLPSTRHTTKYYCIQKSCMKNRFPYYQPRLVEIPAEVRSRLKSSHLDLLKSELDYEPRVGIS